MLRRFSTKLFKSGKEALFDIEDGSSIIVCRAGDPDS